MLFKCDSANEKEILAQPNEDLLQDYFYARSEVSDLDYMTDYAEYLHEDYWREILAAIEYELLRRMGEFDD